MLDRLAKRFTEEEIDNLEHILKVMSDEFMGEVNMIYRGQQGRLDA